MPRIETENLGSPQNVYTAPVTVRLGYSENEDDEPCGAVSIQAQWSTVRQDAPGRVYKAVITLDEDETLKLMVDLAVNLQRSRDNLTASQNAQSD